MQLHIASMLPKPSPAWRLFLRIRGCSLTMSATLCISCPYVPEKFRFVSGISLRHTAQHTTISPAVMKNIARHPSQLPTNPLMTLAARMPVSSPDSTYPMFLALFCGSENCPANGMNSCGMTEQAPSSTNAPQMT